ncbi:MAG TPA: Gfo/Idh/MocA family oxidoreductase [Planctomycetota bacterium]|nr:Gfo/Idh/MocA family oxidoreductase [Planctomycetota bacterium]
MTRLNRRSFLRGTSATVLTLPLSRLLPGQSWRPLGELRIACVGMNSRGTDHIEHLRKLEGVRVVALVDVDAEVVAREAKKFTDRGEKVDTCADVRRVLDRKDIDAISIATPNHWHSLMAIWACQSGKDVYVEKPVSHNVWEGGQLVAAARKYGRIVQAGTQSRSCHGIAEAIAWLQSGQLGRIRLARGLCYKPRQSIGKVDGPQPVPETIDYDLWCGPAPNVPLHREHLHYDWHWDYATGNGDVGNQGIHQMDLARWALGESSLPRRTLSIGARLGYDDDGNTPNTQVVYHDYERAPLLFEVRGLPRDSAAQQGKWGKGMDSYRGASIGVIVHCEGGFLRIPDYYGAVAFDNEGNEVRSFAGHTNHYANFVAAVRSRKVEDLHAPIREGHVSSALCHLGNVSHQLGKERSKADIAAAVASNEHTAEACARMFAHLEANGVDLDKTQLRLGPWLDVDAANERFVGNEAANGLLTRAYRTGFTVPADV